MFTYLGEETIEKSTIDEDDVQQQVEYSITFNSSVNTITNHCSPCNLSSFETDHECESKDTPLPPIIPAATEVGDLHDDTNEGEGFIVDEAVIKSEKKKDAGSTVEINGKWHSLDLVAMICYSKLKQKYQGIITTPPFCY